MAVIREREQNVKEINEGDNSQYSEVKVGSGM